VSAGHDHAHHHAPANFDIAFAIDFALDLGFIGAQVRAESAADPDFLLYEAGHGLHEHSEIRTVTPQPDVDAARPGRPA
jgi:hypothetical protein